MSTRRDPDELDLNRKHNRHGHSESNSSASSRGRWYLHYFFSVSHYYVFDPESGGILMKWILIANTTATKSLNLIWSLRVLAVLISIGIIIYRFGLRGKEKGEGSK